MSQEKKQIEQATQHTPGPWMWGDGFNELHEKYADCQLVGANGESIIPIRIDHHEPMWDIDMPDPDDDSYEPDEVLPTPADRALIAAAPDLLAACRESLDYFGSYESHRGIADTLRQAILKATLKDSNQ